jgi:CDP-diglyceride synthetase
MLGFGYVTIFLCHDLALLIALPTPNLVHVLLLLCLHGVVPILHDLGESPS